MKVKIGGFMIRHSRLRLFYLLLLSVAFLACGEAKEKVKSIDLNNDGSFEIVNYYDSDGLKVKDEMLYPKSFAVKETIFWSNKDTIQRIELDFSDDEYERTIDYLEEPKEVKVGNEIFNIQAVDIDRTYGDKADNVDGQSFYYHKDQVIRLVKVVYRSGAISNVVVNDEYGRAYRDFITYRDRKHFKKMDVYDSNGNVTENKEIKIPIDVSLDVLLNYE